MDKADVVKEIKARIPLSSVIGVAVELKGRSPNFLGLCPFHQEKTPSFHVRDNAARFKCFGCGAAGDIFEFLMRLRGLTFIEAIAELSVKAGIITAHKPVRPKITTEKDALFAQKVAQEFFVKQLLETPAALRYLQQERGLSDRMIRQAGLGFGGMAKDMLGEYLTSKGVSDEHAQEAGLLKEGRFSLIPPFHGRITFPIRNIDGIIVGFGGRAFLDVDKDAPKYVNTHSYSHYEKRRSFYGWHESKLAMQKGAVPVLVEGYFDAMALWALGIPALALCGTALTVEHVKLLRSMSSRLTVCFDSDNAGVMALRNALVLLHRANIDPNLVLLDEKDPGDYLVKRDLKGLAARFAKPTDAICFLIDQAAIGAQESVSERVKQIDLLVPIFASIKRPLLRRQYVAHLAKRLHEEPAILWAEIEKSVKTEPVQAKASTMPAPSRVRLTPEERLALEIAMSEPALVHAMTTITPSLASSISTILENFARERAANPTVLVDELMERAVRDVDADCWPTIREIIRNRIMLSHDEAIVSLKALERKIAQRKVRASIKKKRLELEGFERKKDYASVLSSLKEKSELLMAHKATPYVPEVVAKPAIKKDLSLAPALRENLSEKKIRDLNKNETFFDASEDW